MHDIVSTSLRCSVTCSNSPFPWLFSQLSIMKAVTVLLLLMCCHAVVGKKGQSKFDIKKSECQKKESCKWDESENCVNHCISPSCFNKVYSAVPLEPGEIDRSRAQKFSECTRIEDRVKRREDL